MIRIYLVRHGEVHNPRGIIYARLPGFGLSDRGRRQIARAADLLAPEGPFQALYASPLQRTRESAAILGKRLGLSATVEDRIVETDVGPYQGRRFEELPDPYIAEEPVHGAIECAASIRARFLEWAGEMRIRHPGGKVIGVSHRDPIVVVLLHWMGRNLEELPGFPLPPGSVYEICLDEGEARVRPLG